MSRLAPLRWWHTVLLILAVIAATSPLWRAFLFPSSLTIEQALSFRCAGVGR
jgi:hypothetical protein